MPWIEKLTAGVQSWTSTLLSLAGRVQLIKSFLSAMQSYWTNHSMLSATVHKYIQSLLTRFIWKGDISKKGGARVAWKSFCTPREEGGLGLNREWNIAQMLLHLFKIISKHNFLWCNWVNATELKRLHFWTMETPTDCSWIWWRILELRPLALRHISYKIGNDSDTSLWFDPWWKHSCLA